MKNKVLVLNKNYEPIKINDMFDSIGKVYVDKAYFLDSNFQRYTFEEWKKYSIEHEHEEGVEKINAVSFFILRPYVIIMKVYARYRQPKLNRENLFIRDNGKCQYCGEVLKRNKGTIDHIIPKSKGGKMSWENVVLCCHRCNHKKEDFLLEETNMKLLSKPKSPELVELFLNLNKNKKLDFLNSFIRKVV